MIFERNSKNKFVFFLFYSYLSSKMRKIACSTSETVHKAVEDFVGDAEPTDDFTKMCIKM